MPFPLSSSSSSSLAGASVCTLHSLSLPFWPLLIRYLPLRNPHFTNIVVYELVMGFFYLGGAFVYAIQFPECRFPGKFDLFFNSHQVFHVCIVLAAYAHYLAVREAMSWRYAN